MILAEIDHSLRRLGTDYVDLYQIHRWDDATPIEETLDALHDVVKAGKARYIGASSMSAWQFTKALYTSRLRGCTEFVSMQNHLNLLYREEEREMLPLCADQRIAVLPWSPLARGRLAREPGEATPRDGDGCVRRPPVRPDGRRRPRHRRRRRRRRRRTAASRARRSRSRGCLQKPGVTAPIVGASKPHHLTDAVAALGLVLAPEEIRRLEAQYRPHAVAGISVGR